MILHKAKYILKNRKIIEDGGILVDNNRIIDVLKYFEGISAQIINHGNALITPGFINLHTHLQYTDLKPFKHSENKDFSAWIIDLVKQYFFWSKSKKLESFKNGLDESIKSGVTCVVNLSREEEFLEILNNAQIKSFLFLETFANSESTSEKEFNKLTIQLERMRENSSKDLQIGISPHSVYNLHPELWKKATKYAADNDLLIHTHLGESIDEIAWLKGEHSGIDKLHKLAGWSKLKPEKKGLNPLEYLEYLNVPQVLKENLISAHLNQLSIDSIEKFVGYGSKIAHCSRSNIILHGKTLDIQKLNKKNLKNTGLGTDSKFSNYDLNILKEAKFVKDNTGLSFFDVMDLLTINSAEILKINNITGSLDKGKDADFLVFNLEENGDWQNIFEKEGPDRLYAMGKLIFTHNN
jgi:cytosine/adenosine deaminase-related metal-dependent hydrolase